MRAPKLREAGHGPQLLLQSCEQLARGGVVSPDEQAPQDVDRFAVAALLHQGSGESPVKNGLVRQGG